MRVLTAEGRTAPESWRPGSVSPLAWEQSEHQKAGVPGGSRQAVLSGSSSGINQKGSSAPGWAWLGRKGEQSCALTPLCPAVHGHMESDYSKSEPTASQESMSKF